MDIVAFAASLGRTSLNRKLITLAADVARAVGAQVDLAEFREFELPPDRSRTPSTGSRGRARCPGVARASTSCRPRPRPWAASAVWQTRIPLEGCGALVFPDMFALPHANEAFDDSGRLRDAALAERLRRDVVGFVRLAEAVGTSTTDSLMAAPAPPDLHAHPELSMQETPGR